MTKVHHSSKNQPEMNKPRDYQPMQQYSEESSNSHYIPEQSFAMDNSSALHVGGTEAVISGSYYINSNNTYTQQVAPIYQPIRSFSNNTSNNNGRGSLIHNPSIITTDGTMQNALPSISNKTLGENRSLLKEGGADAASLDTTLSRNTKQEPSLTATPIPSGSSSCDGSSGHGDCVSPIGSLSDLTNPTLAAVETEMSDSTLNEFINNEIFEGISLPDNLGQFDVNNVEIDYGMIEENCSSKNDLIPNSPNSINLVNEAKGPTTSRKRQKSDSTMQGEIQKKVMIYSSDSLQPKSHENSSEPSQSKHRHKHRSKQKRREKVKSHGLIHVGNTASQIPKATADPRSSLVQQPQSSSLLKNDPKEPAKPKTSQKDKVQTEGAGTTVKDKEDLSMLETSHNEISTPVTMTETGIHPLGGVKRWQTVTAVQAPKMPPLLSDQDRIPKRGRPSKQMTEINLKLKKAQASTSVAQAVAPVEKPPVVATVSSLVSTYTITDSGAIQKLSIKHKENKRNKERAEAFRNMLSEISKRTAIENKTAGARDAVGTFNKPGVRTRNQASKSSEDTSSEVKPKPKSKVKGQKKPRVVSEEDVYNFTELAKRYNISNSILFRHLEHTQKLNSIDVTPKLEMAKKQKQPSRSSSSKTSPPENKSLLMIKPAPEKVAAPSAVNRSSVRGSITLHDKALHGSNIKLKLPSSSNAEAEPPTNAVKPRTLNGTSPEKNPEVSKGPKEVSQPDTLAVAPCTSKQVTSQENEKVSKKKSKKSKKKKKHKVKHSKHDKERSKKKDKKKKSKHKHSSKVKNQNAIDQQAPSSKETSKQQEKLNKQSNTSTNEQNTVVTNVSTCSASSYASNSSNEEHHSIGQTQSAENSVDYGTVEVFQDETLLKSNPISSSSTTPPVFGSSMSASGVMPTFRGIKEHGGIINVGQTSDFNISPALNFAGNDSIERLGTEQSSLKKHKYKRKKVLRRSKNTIDPKFLDQMDKLATLFNSAHIQSTRNHFSDTSTAKTGANPLQLRSPSKLFTSNDCASENNKCQSSNDFQKEKLSNLSVFCYEPFFQNHGFVKIQQNHSKRQQVNDKAKPNTSSESSHQKQTKLKPTRTKIRSPVAQSTISLSKNTCDPSTSSDQSRPICSSEDTAKSTPVSKPEASSLASSSSSSSQSSEESATPVDMELLNHIKAAFTKSLNASASVPCEVVNKTFDNAIKTYLQSCSTKNNIAASENVHSDDSSPPPAKRPRGRSKKGATTSANSSVVGSKSPTHTKSATMESNKRATKSSKSTTSTFPVNPKEAQNSSQGKRGPGRPRKRGTKDSNQQEGSSTEESSPASNTLLSLKQPDLSDSNQSLPPNQQPYPKTGKKQSLESVVNKLKNKEGLKETVKSNPPDSQKMMLAKTKKNTKHVDKSSKLDGSASNDIQCNQNQMNSYDCWSSPKLGDSSCYMNPPSSLPKKTNLILSGLLHRQKGYEKCKENTSSNPNKSAPTQPLIPNTYTDDVMSMQCEFQIPYDLWWMLYNKKLPSVNQNVVKRFREIRKNVVYDPCTCSSFPCNCSYVQDKSEVADSNVSSRRVNPGDKSKNAAVKRFKSYERGWGLQTRQDLRKGQFVIEYIGEVLPIKRFQTRLAESYMAAACGKSYCAHLDQNTVIDQHVMANASRYINHSCDPSCELERRPGNRNQHERLCVVAKNDMTSGVEITIDYNKYMYDYCQTEICRCNSAKCRKMFGGVKIRDYNTSQFIERSNKSINILHEKAGFCAETLKNHPAGTLNSGYSLPKEMPSITTEDRKVILDGRVMLIRNLLKATSNMSTGTSSVGNKTFAKKRGGQQSYEMVNDVIRCICRIDREEGTMIQCERCNVWQHCQCMQVDPERYEEAVYLCELCVVNEPAAAATTKKTGSRSSKRSTASKKVTRTSHNCRIREIELVPQPPNAPPGHKYFLSLLKEGLCVKEGDCIRVVHDHRLRRDASSSGAYNPPTRSSSRIQSYNSSTSERTNFIVVEKLWTDESGDKFAYGYHLIRPQDTIHDDDESFYLNELFATPFYEIVPLEAVLGHCYILTPSQYRKGKPKGGKLEEIFVCERLVDSSLQTTSQVYQTPPITDQFVTYRKPLTTFFRDQQVPDQFRKSVNSRAQWLKAMEQRPITSKDQGDNDGNGAMSSYPHSVLSSSLKPNLPSDHRTSENVFKTKRLSGIVNKLTEKASARRKRKT